MTGRADNATVQRRVDTVANLILHGESTSKIRRNASIRRWNMDARTIDRYIAKAREQIAERGEFDKVHQFGLAIARLEQLYGMAVQQKDVSGARGVVKELCQLYGISGPIHVKVEGGITVTNFAEIARLAQQAADGPGEVS